MCRPPILEKQPNFDARPSRPALFFGGTADGERIVQWGRELFATPVLKERVQNTILGFRLRGHELNR